MGESACLMRPFSYSEAKEGNSTAYPLGQSVSLGRYAAESLAWEKWSKFSHKSYVEEAEKYSKPGSVAAKKAFFEKHYRTIAARKAAALLEQANSEAKKNEGKEESKVDDGVHGITPQDSHSTNSNSQTPTLDYEGEKNHSDSTKLHEITPQDSHSTNSNSQTPILDYDGEGSHPASLKLHEITPQDSHSTNSNSQTPILDYDGEESHSDSTELHEITPQDSHSTNLNSETPILDYDGVESHSDSTELENSKEEGDGSVTENHVRSESFDKNHVRSESFDKNHVRSESFDKNGVIDNAEIENLELIEAIQGRKVENSRQLWEIIEMELNERIHMEKPLLKGDNTSHEESEVTSRKKPPHSSSKVPAPIQLYPSPKKSTVEISDSKKPNPKSNHKSINFTPAKEFSKLKSSIIRKIDSSRNASNYKASKECVTPLKTPNMASTSGRSKQPSAAPWSEHRCDSSPVSSSVSLSKPPRRKWQFLPTDCSKFLSACRKKSQSPGIFASCGLRTEERAARRKQRLEEKFNASQEPRVQKQTTLKEKAGTELKKLRPSCCFKARPLPDFYRERRIPKDEMSEAPLVKPVSPVLGRKSTPSNTSSGQSKIPLQRQKSSNKNTYVKHVLEKKNQNSVRSINSRDAVTAHENTSPNIQA